MKAILLSLMAVFGSAWWLGLAAARPADGAGLWIARQEGLYLTGLLAIALMSLSMLLATRPAWLERPLGGLDRVYRLHKWAGILGVGLGAVHWLIKQSSGTLKSLIGSAGRPPKIKYDGLVEVLREFADDMGEPALYLALAMLVVAVWRRFPYHLWRELHRAMPVLYLMLAVHAAMLAPPGYWRQPVGTLLAAALAVGVVSSAISLLGLIGRRRQFNGSVIALKAQDGIAEIRCRLDRQWPGHRPGQFAFITFNRVEGAHPFTIASADRGDRTLTFLVKALGDFTETLARRVEAGQAVTVEGPYGCFQFERRDPHSRQFWVAGGIGISPFMSWLEFLQLHPEQAHRADLHYCTGDRESDRLVDRLHTLCEKLPGIRLHVHSARHGQKLSANSLQLAEQQPAEVWFCGPKGLAEALKAGLKTRWNGRLRFHQEAFEMR